MMAQWVAFLDKLAAEAIAADPMLNDVEALPEAIYRQRCGEEAWKRAVERSKRHGVLHRNDVEKLTA
ncbi:MAG: hypothetical protein K2Y27_30565 [Xanthobacteraceae bacterium]|nr:hypothetical protein [Xanthobacteraceae bacterium]